MNSPEYVGLQISIPHFQEIRRDCVVFSQDRTEANEINNNTGQSRAVTRKQPSHFKFERQM
jgi:hypothetical protein